MKKSNKITSITGLIGGLIGGVLISLFLSGKIIDIPNGTHQGGIIAGVGYVIIVITVIILTLIFMKILKHYKMIN